jgi:beta-glucosidase
LNFKLDYDHDHLPRLHSKLWTVKFKIQNAGIVAGTEIPQLYITLPESAHAPPRVLRGFENVMLTAGETDTVEFRLSRYDLSIWSVEQQAWIAPGHGSGGEGDRTYILHIGASSRDFRLKGSLSLV